MDLEYTEYLKAISLFILKGAGVTMVIYFVTLIFSIPLGVLCALGKLSKLKPLQWALGIYTWIFRGTPLLLQLFFVYYGLALVSGGLIKFDPLEAACLTFVVNYTAYFTEIFRAGIQAIDTGQYEAAKALGMNSRLTMKRIILPQGMKVILPPVGNEAITLIKDTALASVITLNEILKNAQVMVSSGGRIEAYVVAAVIYLGFTAIIIQIFRILEKKYQYY